MQYDRVHYYLTIGGTAVSGLEVWQTGLRFAPVPGIDANELLGALEQISVEDIFEDFRPLFANPDSWMAYPSTFKMTWAKLAPIGINGKYIGSPKIHEGLIQGFNVIVATPPPQLAWVVTLGTGKQFGMARKGRMYFPPPISIPGSISGLTAAVPPEHCTAMRDLVQAALSNAEGEVDTELVPAFAAIMSSSGGVAAPQAAGSTNAVTEISVGNILDTQRRRRGELVELYDPEPALRGLRDTLTPVPRRPSRRAGPRSTGRQPAGTEDSQRGPAT